MTTTNFHPAVRDDLEAIVAMYAKDHLGQGRENPALPLDQRYVAVLVRLMRTQTNYCLWRKMQAQSWTRCRSRLLLVSPGSACSGHSWKQCACIKVGVG